jgi:hypothetical protein
VITAIVVIGLAVTIDVGAIASLVVQRYTKVRTPAGVEVRLRLAATGVRWVTWLNCDLSWTLATAWWVRYLRSGRKTWTVTASDRHFRRGQPVLRGEFATWREARAGLNVLASQLVRGEAAVR